MESLLKAEDLNLNLYLNLANGKFLIPYTQRPYEWNASQVSRLFNDIIAVHEEKKEQHILNFITLYEDEDGYQNIYDGQQRTVTLLLIICAIIHKIEEFGDQELAKQIKEEYIQKKDWRTHSSRNTKVIFGKNETNDFFNEYIIKNNIAGIDFTISDNEKHLKNNYESIKKLLEDYIKDNEIGINEIRTFLENMTNKIYVIVLHTPNEEIANQMFETLNNTGKKLADFYVLKNTCVKMTSEKETAKYWDVIEANTDLLDKSTFLTQFVSIYNGKTSTKQAFLILEENDYFKSKESVLKLLYDMEKVSKYYLELQEPEQRRRRDSESIKDLKKYVNLVSTLKLFKATQYKPVILAMNLKNYNIIEINFALEKILSIQLRNIFVAQDKANTIESFYPNLAKEIYLNKPSIGKILKILQDKIKSDEIVKLKLKSRKITKSEHPRIRYILRKIFDFENSSEIKVNGDTQYVNLEHILPQTPKPNSKWRVTFSEDILEDNIYNIGNLTLLLGKKNTSLGNKEYLEKRLALQTSDIKQNKQIAENENWTRKEIESRAEKLADLYIKIW
ncbi:TPA: DUF262 domain-containing protein [Bacillus cereus]|uniref:DUF262 domain-containing protein n=1 Tax=Bacillus cereus TaxID=1396 RepID=UPI000BF332B7|nr:DUF262 domain-containing protein [Bacillus cereus]PEV31156.1 hypothetical protein CN430_03100 [Bacillus cereus]PFE39191.1 hypothetical protein CN294_18290 [Bacillus cereus]PFK43777.1 hypothetical protein COJ20_06905 [Bacillus cereus]HDX9683709.1 DUF262 domain-containing protein [Bacillus cereus]